MRSYNKVLVALDYSEMDTVVFKALDILKSKMEFHEIEFFHVIDTSIYPEYLEVEQHYPIPEAISISSKVLNLLKERIRKTNSLKAFNWSVKVESGVPYYHILKRLESENYDLLIMGNKQIEISSGITVRRVLSKVSTSVLLIPENYRQQLEKILVPLDFSKQSIYSLGIAFSILPNYNDTSSSIYTLHIISDVNSNIYYKSNSENTISEADLFDVADKTFEILLENENIDKSKVNASLIWNNYKNVSKHINEYAYQNEVDMIVMSGTSKRKVGIDDIGRIIERLLMYNSETYLLIGGK